MKTKILLTGGSGKIGSYFAAAVPNRYHLRLVDKKAWDVSRYGPPPGEVLAADLQDLQTCRRICAGMDVVVHLAADADPEADFDTSLLGNNIIATHNLFRAAKEAGCRRFIYASSAHVVSAYEPDVQINSEMMVRPGNKYGVSKCFGEALASYYAHVEDLPSIVLRIGAYIFPEEYPDFPLNEMDAFLDPDDFNDLLVKCIETPGIQFAVANAISNNRYKRLDLQETREVFGYQPKKDAFEIFQ